MKEPTPGQLRKWRLRLKRRWELRLGVTNYPSQEEVARRIPIHVVNLCKWERGHVTPRAIYLLRWREVLREMQEETRGALSSVPLSARKYLRTGGTHDTRSDG